MSVPEEILHSALRVGEGQHRLSCPACTHTRSRANQRARTLSIRFEDGKVSYTCWHCDLNGIVSEEEFQERRPAQMTKPMKVEPLHGPAIEFLAARGISPEIAQAAGLFFTRAYFNRMGKEGDAIGMPYADENGNRTGAKLRSIDGKDFTIQGTVNTMFGAERCKPGEDVYICEGELDAVAFLQAGINNAISVPHGAPPPGKGNAQGNERRLSALWANREVLKNASRVIIAVDNDAPGEALAEEVARRVGKARCWVLNWPEGTKDANDFMLTNGAEALATYATTKLTMWPLSGLKTVEEFRLDVESLYDRGLPPGLLTGWSNVDDIFTVAPGTLNVLTGIPGSGKSTWLDALLCNLARTYNSKVALASFENPITTHISKLIAQKVGKPFRSGLGDRMTKEEMSEATDWVNDHFLFLSQDGEPPTTENLIERFSMAVMRMGCRVGVIDPFNFIKLNGENETHAINEMLSALKTFAAASEMALFLVAHPAKPQAQSAKDWVPTGYAISGSAHFYNRADFGLTVQRGMGNDTKLHVWKSRFEHLGTVGVAQLKYEYGVGRYHEAEGFDDLDDLDF